MIRWKDTVKFDRLHGAMVLAVMRAEAFFEKRGYECWITSGNDSTHMQGSKHYTGRALDFRVHHLATERVREEVATEIHNALGPQFTVLYESPGTSNAHIHVQFNGE